LPQSIARQKIHPFQYLMVGAALCLFYLLLLSISEFIGFSWAYLIAAVASTGVDHLVLPLLPWRWRAHIHDRCGIGGRLPVSLHQVAATGLRAVHGAIALFIVLAIVMYVTRRVD
jgi:inner membrane protein